VLGIIYYYEGIDGVIFRQLKLLYSIVLFLLIAVSAWPAWVAASAGISYFMDVIGVQDFFHARPKRLWLSEFIHGWKESAPIAAALGGLAVIDMQLLTRKRFTLLIAGISLPIALVALGLFIFKDYGLEMVPVFATTGIILLVVYRFSEILSRIERA